MIPEKVRIGKASVDNVTLEEAIRVVDLYIEQNKKIYVVTPNLDHIVKLEQDPEFIQCYDQAGLVLADGSPLVFASRILGTPLKQRVAGSDLFPAICRDAVEKNYRIYFLGGLEGVAEKAAIELQKKYKGLNIVGTYSPPFGFEKDQMENQKIIHMINQEKPHLLFVGVGAPKQEKWMYHNLAALDINVGLGIGASFDFEAGTIQRAPQWVRKFHMEWFWRFSQEPKRLFRRYFIDSAAFLPIIYRQLKEKRHLQNG